MARILMDTEVMKNVGEDIKAVSVDYKKVIDDLYEKIKNIPDSGAWVSENTYSSVNAFVEAALKDIENNKTLATHIEKLGNQVYKYGDTINKIADNKFEVDVWQK